MPDSPGGRTDAVRALLKALDRHCPGEAAHADRVAVYAVATGAELGWAEDDLFTLRRSAELHDLGKAALDPIVLRSPGPFHARQWEEVRRHPGEAVPMLESIAWLAPCISAILHHHERWDGSGYPEGLSRSRIPAASRIIGVAEAFDAMTFPYGARPALSESEALDELRLGAGSQFDPDVVDVFRSVQPLIQPVVIP